MTDTVAGLVNQLVAARRRQQITQAELGARLGLTKTSVANWEGGRQPSVETFILWAGALHLYLAVVDDTGATRTTKHPVPPVSGEETWLYHLRVLTLTLRAARTDASMTQHDLAALLRVSEWTVRQWENQHRVPRIARIVEWPRPLRCHLELKPRPRNGRV